MRDSHTKSTHDETANGHTAKDGGTTRNINQRRSSRPNISGTHLPLISYRRTQLALASHCDNITSHLAWIG